MAMFSFVGAEKLLKRNRRAKEIRGSLSIKERYSWYFISTIKISTR